MDAAFDLAREGEAEALRALLDQGLAADTQNARGDSLLMVAAYAGRQATAQLLLEPRRRPRPGQCQGPVADRRRRLPGRCWDGGAAARPWRGAGRRRGGCGRTALLTAALFDRAAVVELLLARGADPHKADAKGMTPLQAARAMGARVTPALLAEALGQA